TTPSVTTGAAASEPYVGAACTADPVSLNAHACRSPDTLAEEITDPAATRVFARSPFGYGHDPAAFGAFGLLTVLPVGPLEHPAATRPAATSAATAARLPAGSRLRGRIARWDWAGRSGRRAC